MISQVNHYLVHGYSAHDGNPHSLHQHVSLVGELSVKTISITDGYGGNDSGFLRRIRSAVADGLSGLHLFFKHDGRSQGHHLLQGKVLIHLVGGKKPVNHNPGPNHIEVGIVQIDDGAAIETVGEGDMDTFRL